MISKIRRARWSLSLSLSIYLSIYIYIYIYIYIILPPVPIHSKIDYIEVRKICLSASVILISLLNLPYRVTTCNLQEVILVHVKMNKYPCSEWPAIIICKTKYKFEFNNGKEISRTFFYNFRFLDVTTKGVNDLHTGYFCVSCLSHINSDCFYEDHWPIRF